MNASKGLEGEDALQAHLQDLDAGDYWKGRSVDHFFGAWVTALYARQFNPHSLSSLYSYGDELESLPDTRERTVEIHNCAFNAATQGYAPEPIPIGGSVLYNDMDPATWNQQVDSWRSRYYAFKPDQNANIVIVWVDGKTGQRNYYSIMTSKGNDVQDLGYQFSEDMVRAYFNDALEEVGIVVGALDQRADFDVLVWAVSDFSLDILSPTSAEPDTIRIPDDQSPTLFQVSVQVRAYKEQTPDDDNYVDGLSPGLFEVEVDGQTAEVVNGHQTGNSYRLVCKAPSLPPGEYDLQVTLINQQDLERDAIRYADIPLVDRMVVIDRSGSMGSNVSVNTNNEKMLAAKAGGRLYTDLVTNGSQIGLASFGGDDDGVEDDATLHRQLKAVAENVRGDVKSAINRKIPDNPAATQLTAMGQGVMEGYWQLTNSGKPENTWRIALLTDGMENIAPYWNSVAVKDNVVPSKIKVDTVALGQGAHERLLQDIAEDTGGKYYHVAVPEASSTSAVQGSRSTQALTADPVLENHMANVYRLMNEQETGSVRIWSDEGTATPPASRVNFEVYQGMQDLVLTVNWPSVYSMNLSLVDPNGNKVSPLRTDSTHAVYSIPEKKTGIWQITFGTSEGVPYHAILSGRGLLDCEVFTIRTEDSDIVGSVQTICMRLLRKTKPVPGAEVQAEIIAPNGKTSMLRLMDDGDHGDGRPGDGIYSRNYRLTPMQGSYRVHAVAAGKKDVPYRLEGTAFFLRTFSEEYDKDRDGLPDEWEIRYGLNPGDRSDAKKDNDQDNLINLEEFHNGGNPADSDTDQGGSQDGAELKHGLDMLDYADDRIAPPSSLSINRQQTDFYDPDYRAPASGENLIYWSRGRSYKTVDIYRAGAEEGPYALIKSGVPAEKRPYSDKGLTNGKIHYYRIAARTEDGLVTRLSEPAAGIPKEDNVRPRGSIQIDAPPILTSRNALLKLWAEPDTKQMRFSNTGSFQDSSWVPFAKNYRWQIAGNEGANFVYVQFRDAAGNVSRPFFRAVRYESDSDSDRLGDAWEIQWFGSLKFTAGGGDADGDGLLDKEEFGLGTMPLERDTDKDGIPDGWEKKYGLLPTIDADGPRDDDGDGVSNVNEFLDGSNPLDAYSFSALKRPDLAVDSFSGPKAVCAGDDLGSSIGLVVRNAGKGQANATGGYFTTDLLLSTDAVLGNSDDLLLLGGRDQITEPPPPGESRKVILSGSKRTPPDMVPGSYFLGIVLDSVGNRVQESDETNNAALTEIEILDCDEPSAGAGPGLIYSTEENSKAAWMWDGKNPRVDITHADLGLHPKDNIDALSLGDDTVLFNRFRFDFFVVGRNAVGLSGDVQKRVAGGLNVQRDLYVEDHNGSNRLCLEDLISQSTGSDSRGAMDAFDFGDHGLMTGDRVYFSLSEGSPTLRNNKWRAGDVLVAEYQVYGTLARYAPAKDLGSPADIDALSIHDHYLDAVFNPSIDSIIHSRAHTGDVSHYGFRGPNGPCHAHAEFGLLKTDELVALEHKTLPCCTQGHEDETQDKLDMGDIIFDLQTLSGKR